MNLLDCLKRIFPVYRAFHYVLDSNKTIIELSKYQNERVCKLVHNSNKQNEYLFWISQIQSGENLSDCKKRIFLNLPKAEGDHRKIQIANALLLHKLKMICDENGLKFYLYFGTLLGAIRHHGFIPWDDDIDVVMLREDCNRLKEILKDNRELECHNYHEYGTGNKYIKVKYLGVECFWVDIFPMDYIDTYEKGKEECFIEITQMQLRYKSELRKLYEKFGLNNQSSFRPVVNCDIDCLMKNFENSIYHELPYYGHGNSLCFSIEKNYSSLQRMETFILDLDMIDLDNPKNVEFEGESYYSFNNPEKILNNIYGDIWSFPGNISSAHSDETVMNERETVFLEGLISSIDCS